MPNVLVTGINGFVGTHLTREFAKRGWSVYGVGQQDKISDELADIVDGYYQVDLTKKEEVKGLSLDKINAVVNLAGLAQVGTSYSNPKLYQKINADMFRELGETIIEKNKNIRLLAVSSGAVYDSEQNLPLTEKSKTLTGGSPYAQSKLAMEQAAEELRTRGLDCVIARPFNHCGPGQLPGFLIPDLKGGVLKAEQTGAPLFVGNLNTKRDYTDVRDVVKAYADLAASETLEEYLFNVCSGQSRSGQEVLDLMLDELGLKNKIEVVVDQSKIRPSDPPELYGSFARIQEETSWEPTISFEQTIKDFLNC